MNDQASRQDIAAEFSARFLRIFARGMGSDQRIDVAICKRAKERCTVVVDSRTIVLGPNADLMDLAVAAGLLKHRSRIVSRQNDGTLSSGFVRSLVRRTIHSLRRAFPGFDSLRANYSGLQPGAGLVLSRQDVQLRDIDPTEILKPELNQHLDIRHVGAENDSFRLLQHLEMNRHHFEYWAPLREMPIATVPLASTMSHYSGKGFARYTRAVNSDSCKASIKRIRTCLMQRARDSMSWTLDSEPCVSGSQICSSRLYEIFGSMQSERPPRIFRRWKIGKSDLHHPGSHHVVIAFDTHTLAANAPHDRYLTWRWLAVLFEVYREFDMSVIAFSDQIVQLPISGKDVMLHLPTVLKTADEPLEQDVICRFMSLVESPPQIPSGTPCVFHPLQFRSALDVFTQAANRRSYSQESLLLTAREGMPAGFARRDVLTRTANAIDSLIESFEEQAQSDFTYPCCVVPEEIRKNAVSGGPTASMF